MFAVAAPGRVSCALTAVVTFGCLCTRNVSAGTPQGVVTGAKSASPAMTSWYVYQPGLAMRATGVPTVPDFDTVNVLVTAGAASQRAR